MKVGIILFQNMKYAPFLNMYKRIFDSMDKVEYNVIYLNREKNLSEVEDEQHIAIKWKKLKVIKKPVVEKVYNCIAFIPQVRKVLIKNKYDFLVVLTTMPAILIYKILLTNYANKYILDIRDYTKEHIKAYFRIEKKIVQNSALNIISSPAFKSFLPISDYNIIHNVNVSKQDLQIEKYHFKKTNNRPIVISYIGSIQYEKQCEKLIEMVACDNRFVLYFYGNECNGDIISQYVRRINSSRILMKGSFIPEDKPRIFSESDLVFNCYGNDSLLVKCAISNKHYDGAFYRRPLIVSPNTVMKHLAGEFAYALDLSQAVSLDGLYQWYVKLDCEAYEQYARKILDRAIEENEKVEVKIKRLLRSS